MSSAEVQQLDALADLFADALAACQPASLAILGVAGGNGLDRIDRRITTRVVGLDINPDYLAEVQARFNAVELHCVDLAAEKLNIEPVALVHAALVFEHAGVDVCLQNAVSLIAPGGALSAVLQLPSQQAQGVGASPFPSLQRLKETFSMIDPEWLENTLRSEGFELGQSAKRSLPAGKSFWLGIFRRTAG